MRFSKKSIISNLLGGLFKQGENKPDVDLEPSNVLIRSCQEAILTWRDVSKAIDDSDRELMEKHQLHSLVERWVSYNEGLMKDEVSLTVHRGWGYRITEAFAEYVLNEQVARLLMIVREAVNLKNASDSLPAKSEDSIVHALDFNPGSSDLVMGDEIGEFEEGESAYRPVNVANNFHHDKLYYPVDVIETSKEPKIKGKGWELVERKSTIVIRSDRQKLHATPSRLPNKAGKGEVVYRLSDGTLVSSPPRASSYSTWSWESIQEFLDEKEPEDIGVLVRKIHAHLSSKIWLPKPGDYWILSLAAATSYCQAIFDAVPLILLTGPAGTGKSAISTALSEVSANSVMVSQGSAATLMRLVDESGGLVVVDDLEAVGTGQKKGQDRFNEIAQVLKVSYKKSSASRVVTDMQTGRTRIMNFFGIKVISNTLGVDKILGSRMLHVYTMSMPSSAAEDFHKRTGLPEEELGSIQDAMHTWAFSNVSKIHDEYNKRYKSNTNRGDEIAAPLRVIASMTNDLEIIEGLESSLSSQGKDQEVEDAPETIVSSIVNRLIKEGYISLSPLHVQFEILREHEQMKQFIPNKETPTWATLEWVSRILRDLDVIDESGSKRKRLYGTQLTVLPIKEGSVAKNIPLKEAKSFCDICATCQYKNFDCPIKPRREKAKTH